MRQIPMLTTVAKNQGLVSRNFPPRRLVRATDVHIGISRSFFYSVQYSLCITVLHSLTAYLSASVILA